MKQVAQQHVCAKAAYYFFFIIILENLKKNMANWANRDFELNLSCLDLKLFSNFVASFPHVIQEHSSS